MPRESVHRDQLLDAAFGLMLTKGFPATSVDEVCAAAGVTKGSFYHHFRSKEELARVLLEVFFERVRAHLDGDWVAREDPLDRVLAFINHLIDIARSDDGFRRGCLMGSFSLDLAETHPEIQRELDARFNALSGLLEPHLAAAIERHPPTAQLDPGRLARHLVAVLQGSIVLAKASGDPERVAEGLACHRELLAGLFNRRD